MTPERRHIIETTLQNLITVQNDDGANILMGRPGFSARCHRLEPVRIVYVDGYVGGCKWNSWNVMQMGLEADLRVWQGYALSNLDGRWLEHCWLMRGDKLIETTGSFSVYYGAELNDLEIAEFNAAAAGHDPVPASQKQYWFSWGEGGRHRSINASMALGRERDPKTLEVVEGIGRD